MDAFSDSVDFFNNCGVFVFFFGTVVYDRYYVYYEFVGWWCDVKKVFFGVGSVRVVF